MLPKGCRKLRRRASANWRGPNIGVLFHAEARFDIAEQVYRGTSAVRGAYATRFGIREMIWPLTRPASPGYASGLCFSWLVSESKTAPLRLSLGLICPKTGFASIA